MAKGETITDKEYVRERNKLIPHAVKHADEVVGEQKWGESDASWALRWNRAFLDEMDRLAEAENLTRPFKGMIDGECETNKLMKPMMKMRDHPESETQSDGERLIYNLIKWINRNKKE